MDAEYLSEQALREIESRCEAATLGPWYPRITDDQVASSALYIGTQPGTKMPDGFCHDNRRGLASGDKQQEPPGHVIAITLLQDPHLADIVDARWDENTLFIAQSRTDIPMLLREVRRLRSKLNIE